VAIAFSAAGDRAYSAFANGDKIGLYDIDPATGVLELVLQATDTGPQPVDLALTPDGRYGYSAIHDPATSGHVELYDVRPEDGLLYDATTGAPEARANFLAGAQPWALELAPAGDRLYVLNRGSGTVTTFTASALNGELTSLDVDAVGADPGAMAMSVVVE
jgi:6-phosphogluconolactonase (cycloisomerase 2 family)